MAYYRQFDERASPYERQQQLKAQLLADNFALDRELASLRNREIALERALRESRITAAEFDVQMQSVRRQRHFIGDQIEANIAKLESIAGPLVSVPGAVSMYHKKSLLLEELAEAEAAPIDRSLTRLNQIETLLHQNRLIDSVLAILVREARDIENAIRVEAYTEADESNSVRVRNSARATRTLKEKALREHLPQQRRELMQKKLALGERIRRLRSKQGTALLVPQSFNNDDDERTAVTTVVAASSVRSDDDE